LMAPQLGSVGWDGAVCGKAVAGPCSMAADRTSVAPAPLQRGARTPRGGPLVRAFTKSACHGTTGAARWFRARGGSEVLGTPGERPPSPAGASSSAGGIAGEASEERLPRILAVPVHQRVAELLASRPLVMGGAEEAQIREHRLPAEGPRDDVMEWESARRASSSFLTKAGETLTWMRVTVGVSGSTRSEGEGCRMSASAGSFVDSSSPGSHGGAPGEAWRRRTSCS